jgi:transcriptional regulator with XRE-family HTH domain
VSYLNDIEHDRTVPTLRKLRSIADVLGLSVRDLLEGVSPYDGN